MKKTGDFLSTAASWFVLCLSMLMIGFLLIQDFFVNVQITVSEQTIFSRQAWWQYIVAVVVVLILLCLIDWKWDWNISNRTLKIITVCYFAVLLVFVLATRMEPKADPFYVLHLSTEFEEQKYSSWEVGRYGDMYHNQYALIYIMSLFAKIWGGNNWIAFQIINIFCVILAAYGMKKLVKLIYHSDKFAAVSYLAVLLYAPLGMYVTFVYGTLPGLACAVWGAYFVLKSVMAKRLRPATTGIGACLLVLAALLKNNYLIVLLGVAAIVFLHLLRQKRVILLVPLLLLPILYGVSNTAINGYVASRAGVREDSGIPYSAWVVMGLQEGETRAPGWFNGYPNNVYKDQDCDSERASEKSEQKLDKILDKMLDDPIDTLQFFGTKTASEWNEATFQSLWINMVREEHPDSPMWLQKLLDEKCRTHQLYVWAADIALFLIWVGILAFLWKERHNPDPSHLVWAVVFIGGFLFHLFWEAKSQYTLVYVWLCIPYAVGGYRYLTRKVTALFVDLGAKCHSNRARS
ncbi:MAG: glycosyltransferase family 39 protein [Lachnospiraceae bacterium]|nr:glycosyltransferase family 39 protein [Lachnospiraceae bacterium]